MLNTNRRRYYREMIETGLNKIGLKGTIASPIIEKIENKIYLMPEHSLVPDSFFNFERSARIIANQESLSAKDIVSNLGKHIEDLFEIHDLLVGSNVKPNFLAPHATNPEFDVSEPVFKKLNGKGRPRKLIPDLETIARAAIDIYAQTAKMPNIKTGHAHLPEGSISWGAIIIELRSRELRLKNIMVDYAAAKNIELPGVKKSETKIGEKTPKKMPSHDSVAVAAISYLNENNKLPSHNSGRNGIPDNSVGWAMIVRNLREEKTTISRIVATYAAMHEIQLPKKIGAKSEAAERSKKIVPSNDIIAQAAIDILKDTGKMPNSKSIKTGLPENSRLVWSGIIAKLRKEKTPLADIVKTYATANNIDLPHKEKSEHPKKIIPSEIDVAIAAITFKKETGRMPKANSGYACLPENAPGWCTVMAHYRKAGKTITQIVEENRDKLPASEIHARDLFNNAVAAIHKNKALPAPDPAINRSFQENKVIGLEDVLGKNARKASCAESFYAAAGLAEISRDGKFVAVRAEVIQQYARLIATKISNPTAHKDERQDLRINESTQYTDLPMFLPFN